MSIMECHSRILGVAPEDLVVYFLITQNSQCLSELRQALRFLHRVRVPEGFVLAGNMSLMMFHPFCLLSIQTSDFGHESHVIFETNL